MRNWIVIISVFWLGFSFAQINQTDSKGRKQGEWIKYYPKTKIPEYKGTFIDDKPTGLFHYYAPDGGLSMIAKHNEKSGRSEVYFYHDDKKIKCHGIYINMQKDSVWTYVSNNGIISKRETYKNGVLNGMTYSYYVNNVKKGMPPKIVEETPYKNGKKEGLEKEYFITGGIKRESEYKNDLLHGFTKNYGMNGKVETEVYFFNGKRHGYATYYTPEGKMEYTYFIYGRKVEFEEYKEWRDMCQKKNKPTNLPVRNKK